MLQDSLWGDGDTWNIEYGPLKVTAKNSRLTVYDPYYKPVKRALNAVSALPTLLDLNSISSLLAAIVETVCDLDEVAAEAVVEITRLSLDLFGAAALARLARGARVAGEATVSSSASASVSVQRTLSSYVDPDKTTTTG